MTAPAPFRRAEPLLTAEEVGRLLGMSTAWVRRHAGGKRRPHLPCMQFGRTFRFRESEVWAWAEEMRRRWER